MLGNLHRFDFRFRFSTWLFTIARRLYMNAMAKNKPVYDTDFVGSMGGSQGRSNHDSESAVFADERQSVQHDALQQALLALTNEQREIIILFHQLDWSISLIASHLDMPEGTIKSHLHRGRKRLRVMFKDKSRLAEQLAGVAR